MLLFLYLVRLRIAALVGGLEELPECLVGRGGGAHGLVGQDELAEIRVPDGPGGTDLLLGEAIGRGVRVGVEDGRGGDGAAGPEARAGDLLGVGLPGDPIRQVGDPARVRGGRPSGEAGHREVEAAPEEMNGAVLADEPRPEALEDAVHLEQDPPESLRGRRVVGGVRPVLGEGNRVLDLVGPTVDRHREPQPLQGGHERAVEVRGRLGLEGHHPGLVVTGGDEELVLQEVEVDLEGAIPVGDGRGGQPTRGDVEGDVPRVVDPRRLGEPHLPHDLGPHVQRGRGVLPVLEGKRRPALLRSAPRFAHGSSSFVPRAPERSLIQRGQRPAAPRPLPRR